MSRKRLILLGISLIVIINGSIFGTVYIVDWLQGPSSEELDALREAEEQAALDAIYASLPPLPEFKSKASYLHSIGEAISLCEDKLHASVSVGKSWEVNMIESRYVPAMELYKIFLEYETLTTVDHPAQRFKVTCEVSGEKKSVELWKAEAT